MEYYIILAAISSALFALMFAFASTLFGSMMGGWGMMTGAAFGTIFGAGGAILHIGVYIAGGKNGITQTIKAVMYGQTPGLFLGWIPFVNFIAGIWSLVLEVLGIRQLQELIVAAVIASFMFGMGRINYI